MKDFIVGRFKGGIIAIKGALILLKTEASIKVQFSIGILLVIAGFYFELSHIEWMFQVLIMGAVLGTEALNTAIEEVADFIHPEYHKKIGLIKDIASGAVFFVALSAVVILGLIYLPKII